MTLPSINPLRLGRRAAPFSSSNWIFELKWDGFRSLAYIEGESCRLLSRKGREFQSFPSLAATVARLPAKDAVVDGEIVCLDLDGRANFRDLLFRRVQPFFYAFDLLWLNGVDLRSRQLLERKRLLRELLFGAPREIHYVDYVEGRNGHNFFSVCCDHDLEGVVAKRRDSTYLAQDEKSSWLKIKNSTYSQNQGREELFQPYGRQAEVPQFYCDGY